MSPDAKHWLLQWVGVLAGYALMMLTNPTRESLRDGFRCLWRYRQIWLVPASFGVAHAGFGLWVRVFEARMVPGSPAAILPWTGWQPPLWAEVITASRLPTLESTAAIFNCLVTTFPLSALAAGLFLVNWRGYQATVYRALSRRLDRGPRLAVHLALLSCALAAVIKPLLFGGLPRLNTYFGEAALVGAGEAVNALSFFFEYLLGVSVQIYLVLLALAWVRGLGSSFEEIRQFALRRFAFVVKWAGVVLAIGALGINLPLLIASLQAGGSPWEPTGIIQFTRVFLATAILVFCPTQLLLVFHNESLRQALGDALRMWRRFGGYLGWLLAVAAVHFLLLSILNAFLLPALGQWTWPAAAWNVLVYPLLWSGLGGWFLASWVCLFRRCERNVPGAGDLIRF